MAVRTIRGRGVVPGIVEGEALVCPKSINGWEGVDPETGIIQEYGNINEGKCIKGKILVLPGSRGSNGWSCYFSATRVAGTAPKGWLFSRIDSASGVAAAMLRIPTVVDFNEDEDPCAIITTGDQIRMNGETGMVEILDHTANGGTNGNK